MIKQSQQNLWRKAYDMPSSSRLKIVLADTLHRIYPHSKLKTSLRSLEAARGERISFQVGVHNPSDDKITVKLSLQTPTDFSSRIRRVGYVPVPHANTKTPLDETDGPGILPGYVPDPLFDEDTLTLGPNETHSFWCNVAVDKGAKPKTHPIRAALSIDGKPVQKLQLGLKVHPIVIQPRRNFPIVQWLYADALCDFYRVEPFDEAFWKIAVPYMKNLIDHFEDCVYVPLFTPPTDGVKRPTQLLKIKKNANGRYSFDWSQVKRWIDLARSLGLQYFEWTHFFTQWGVKCAIRIYDESGQLLWQPETEATSDTYREFLSQLLPGFKAFLDRENLLDKSFFHVSDEPGKDHVANYRKARGLLKDLAPWLKVMDALSEIEFGHETDLPIAICSSAPEFTREKIEHGVYYCCWPRGRFVNRLMDTTLAKIRMNGWLFYRFQPKLFLHWGYNYWHKSQTTQLIDPFYVSDGQKWPGWAYGDTFCVYPGPNGPIDSIRWEVFAESMQDYALMQTLGIDPAGKLLRPIKDYQDFPRDAAWITRTRRALLAGTR
jgi:hypothetical protein